MHTRRFCWNGMLLSTRLAKPRRPLRYSAVALVLALWTGCTGGFAGEIRRQFDLRVPMRDGVRLSADVWFPAAPGRYPVILVRTPYMKSRAGTNFPQYGAYFASRGYVFAGQDVRGRGDSDGEFGFFEADINDGHDTVEWLAKQPWSNGRVGMMGVSYLGSVQLLAARAKPPHLVCIVPTAPGGLDGIFNYLGGAVVMAWHLPWRNTVQGRIYQSPNAEGVDWDRVFKHRPLLTMDEAFGRITPLYREFLKYPDWDPHWKNVQFGPEVFEQIDIPALHVTGWFDGDQPTAMYCWRGMVAHSPSKDRQYLLAGPWTHGQTYSGGGTKLGDMEFSEDSIVDNKALHLAFFDHYLSGTAPKFDFPRARIYLTGDNRWRDFDQYPPAEAQIRRLYLQSAGKANTLHGDGKLSWNRSTDKEPPDKFTYDPHNPSPSTLNGEELPLDHRSVERRDDVLVYTTGELTQRVEFIGRPYVELYAASDARDTDFTAKLLDVHPDGRAIRLGTLPIGVIRARYRHGLMRPELLEPGSIEKYRIELFDLAHTFLPRHRIRVEISSSAYSFIAPNQNTGNPVATDTQWRTAHQTIYHNRGRPSHLALPVMPK